jgi:hypothetical protein
VSLVDLLTYCYLTGYTISISDRQQGLLKIQHYANILAECWNFSMAPAAKTTDGYQA